MGPQYSQGLQKRRRGGLRRPIETAVRELQLSSWFKDEGKGQESRNLEKLQKKKKKKKLKKVDFPQPQEYPEKHLCNPMEPLGLLTTKLEDIKLVL